MDKEIIALRGYYQSRTRIYDLMKDEIPICGKKVRFVPFPLFDGKVCAWLPEDFVVMPERIANVRYITEYRPPVILTIMRYDENFCFHLLTEEALQGDASLDAYIRKMKDAILLHAPETVMYDQGDIVSDKLKGKWFEYKNFTLDEETYHLQFLISFGAYLLAGAFNCRMMFYEEWKKAVIQSLEYMEIGEKEEKRNEGR